MADTMELTAESTKEDIDNYVEQVVQEVKEERAGEQTEQKSDAQITSEHANNEHRETPAEETSGSESAEADTGKGEETAEVDDTGNEETSWLDDDLKAEVAAYGIEESELADFTSREEVDRALRLFDKSTMDAGRKALAETDSSETGKPRNEKGQFEKQPEPKADPPAKREGQFEFKPDIYDEDLEEDLKGYRDYVDARLEAVESRFAEADAIAKERHFDQLVDSLGHADLFGKTDHETDKEKQFREDLFVEAETYLRGRQSLGRPTELNKALLNRIARSLFSEQLGKKELKKRTRKISKQSNGRQGGGETRPQDPREDPRDEFDRLYKEMERA